MRTRPRSFPIHSQFKCFSVDHSSLRTIAQNLGHHLVDCDLSVSKGKRLDPRELKVAQSGDLGGAARVEERIKIARLVTNRLPMWT